MLTATVTDGGKLVLPKALRKKWALMPGDKVSLFIEKDGRRAVLQQQISSDASLFGCLSAYKSERPVTDDDIRQTIIECACRGDRP